MRSGSAAALGVAPGTTGSVAILAAMRREIVALEAGAEVSEQRRDGLLRTSLGRLGGASVILACTGDGAGNASEGARALFDRYSVGSVIVVGVAGALSPSLAPGSLLAAREVVEPGRSVPPPDPGRLQRVLRDTGAIPATFLSTPQILGTARAKAEAYAGLPRDVIAAVDLETAAFARAASERGLPYVALRAISDTAEESLPMDFNALRDGTGAVDHRRVALRALSHPLLLASLWKWRARLVLCSNNLARAVQVLLAGECP